MQLYYSRNLNPRVAVAVARHLQSPVEFIAAQPRHPDHEEAFRPINPNTLVPVLVDGPRTYWETDAIACRLSQLAGSDFWRTDADMPEMVMWISWATHHLTRHGDAFYFWRLIAPQIGLPPADEDFLAGQMREFRKFAAILDAQLAGKTWLVGNRLSYADFRVGTVLPFAKAAGLPVADYPNVQRFSDRLDQIDAWLDPFAGL